MNRRDLLKAAAITALPVGALAETFEEPKRDYEDRYWKSQRQIDELEEYVERIAFLYPE